jgi:hypothetical protein
MKRLRFLGALAFSLCFLHGNVWSANPIRSILLWPDGAPGAVGRIDADKPSLDIYLPAPPGSGTAVVVVPGGRL